MDNFLSQIEKKVDRGIRLTKEDGVKLYEVTDLLELGRIARKVKLNKTGKHIFFNVNKHINLTNICTAKCKFCAFGKDETDIGAYVMTIDEVINKAKEALPQGITELHIVSALHPDIPFKYYVDVLSQIREIMPQVHLQAFTAVEIDYFSQLTGLSVKEVLHQLIDAGLGSMPGGGAEVFSKRVREDLCNKKASGEKWLQVMETAHNLGLKTNATMLYGHIETIEERIEHLIALRELQDKTGGFQAFIPLPFHPENTELAKIKRTNAYEDLKTIAISRLMLDNFDHVKAYWVMLGLEIAQIAMEFGADDLDGTVVEEKITHAAGARTSQGITKTELLKLIKSAGFFPVERDTLYNILQVYEGGE